MLVKVGFSALFLFLERKGRQEGGADLPGPEAPFPISGGGRTTSGAF